MRLFITTYQKTGTHQLYPMFANEIGRTIPVLKGYSANNMQGVPKRFGKRRGVHADGIEKTARGLAEFSDRAMGHIGYRPEYAQVFIDNPTKVLFGIRDPRDVVVAEYENLRRHVAELRPGAGFLNWTIEGTTHRLIEGYDPVADLIEIASTRWPNWLGWLDHDFVMPVRFEELRLDRRATIEKIKAFVAPHGTAPTEEMLGKASPTDVNPTFRKGLVGEWETTFQDHHKEMAEELLRPIMERLGYA